MSYDTNSNDVRIAAIVGGTLAAIVIAIVIGIAWASTRPSRNFRCPKCQVLYEVNPAPEEPAPVRQSSEQEGRS